MKTNDEGNPMARTDRPSPHFFHRDGNGSVRVRMRFDDKQASLFEEAAGETPLMVWITRTLEAAATRQVKAARSKLRDLPPPQ